MSQERKELLGFPAVTAEEIRDVDRLAVEKYGISHGQMMEMAGDRLASLAAEILGLPDHHGTPAPILLMIGPGDNGSAGLVASRLLSNRGLEPRVVCACEMEKLGEETLRRLHTLRQMGIRITEIDPEGEGPGLEGEDHPALIIDALVGSGLTGPLEGKAARPVKWMNGAGAPILSLDVPSGLDPTTGERDGPCVQAHTTMALALPKTGLLVQEARKVVGRLILADIGLPRGLYADLGLSVTGRFPPLGRLSLLA
ncbi:MAG: NAD(P)H-hydrate epimerase [bacterium]